DGQRRRDAHGNRNQYLSGPVRRSGSLRQHAGAGAMRRIETSKVESRKVEMRCARSAFFSTFRPFAVSAFSRRGLSYVEVVMSLMIISIAVASSLQAFGSYAVGRRAFEERAVAIELANQLMAEINRLPFSDPSGGNTIGIDSGESASDRSTFDDI